jgi:carbon monoxide dehydrogenase subunit G
MKLEGTAEFPYDPAAVWRALHDVDTLVKTIPGCKSMIATGDNEYDVAVALGVAAIKGEYTGKIHVDDVEFPSYYIINGEGSGTPGYVKVKVDCHLDATDNGTSMRWSSDAEVGGLIAGIGGRVLTGISKHMAKQFFKALSKEMESAAKPTQDTDANG